MFPKQHNVVLKHLKLLRVATIRGNSRKYPQPDFCANLSFK
jgi:hypothetical protein